MNPALSDEFSGSSLDSTKWIPYSPLWKGRLPSRFETGNVRVYGGNLELRGSLLVNSLADVRDIKKDIWIGAANVSSRSPSASYGYYEARLKASRLSMTSAFWFQAERGPLDDISEIDVVEQFGAADSAAELGSYMRSNTHYFDHGWKNDRQTQFRVLMNGGTADQFHTYGVWWRNQDSVSFFLDGVEVRQVKTPKPFQWPMYLFFDTEPWAWAGFPSPSSLKDSSRNTMYVDWIRAWTLRRPITQR